MHDYGDPVSFAFGLEVGQDSLRGCGLSGSAFPVFDLSNRRGRVGERDFHGSGPSFPGGEGCGNFV
jgi:hypothetical protein